MDPPADQYMPIFAAYMEEMRAARADALRWWSELMEREVAACRDTALARQRIRARWPLGPTAHPRVLAVYRKYYLAISDMNAGALERSEQAEVPADPLDGSSWAEEEETLAIQHPRTILYERVDEVDQRLARFLDALVFVPVGIDPQGRLA